MRKRPLRQNYAYICGENVKFTLKFRPFYPQFETFLPLKSPLCQFYVAKGPLELHKNLQQIC